jgi:cytochrome c5
MPRNSGFILAVCALSAALLFSVVLGEAESYAAPMPKAQEALPEEVVQKNCQGCHDLRPIQTSAMNAEGWTKTIRAMIDDNGAEVPETEIPALVKYLAQHHGPLPDGQGKSILLNTCTMCHDLGRIKTGRRSAEEWEETLSAMLNEGAPLSDAEFPVIHAYLSKHFNVE